MKKTPLFIFVLLVALVVVAFSLGPAYIERDMNRVSPHTNYVVSEQAKTRRRMRLKLLSRPNVWILLKSDLLTHCMTFLPPVKEEF